MIDYLDQFLHHELLIDIGGASQEELKELDNIIKIPLRSGQTLYGYRVDEKHLYLHCRVNLPENDPCKDIGLSHSSNPVDTLNGDRVMPFFTCKDFLSACFSASISDISEDEIDSLFR